MGCFKHIYKTFLPNHHSD